MSDHHDRRSPTEDVCSQSQAHDDDDNHRTPCTMTRGCTRTYNHDLLNRTPPPRPPEHRRNPLSAGLRPVSSRFRILFGIAVKLPPDPMGDGEPRTGRDQQGEEVPVISFSGANPARTHDPGSCHTADVYTAVLV